MLVRILDLDGAVTPQAALASDAPAIVPLRDWGPAIRICCSFGRFRRFERELAERSAADAGEPAIRFCGSGDFHHVTVALLRQIREPFNLLIVDKHPDWVGHAPLMHCGTWVNHALAHPQLARLFHVGADLDLDNVFRWVAPWWALESGKAVAFPAVRRLSRGRWERVPTRPLRAEPDRPMAPERLDEVCGGLRGELARLPLYVTIDKDVMRPADALVNWDSGRLELSEILRIVQWFVAAADGRLLGMDVMGDWSPPRVHGLLRRALDKAERAAYRFDPSEAAARNGRTNRALVDAVRQAIAARAARR
ncbi:MAG: hypothetical protein U0610_27985 [bacterium]